MSSARPAWPVQPFAEVADYGVGKTPARANDDYWDQSGDVAPWVAISDLSPYGLVTATKESISHSAFERVFHGALVPAGTLLMSFKLTIGRVATLAIPAIHNEAIISVYPRKGIDQRFLGYYLSQYDYTELQDRQIKGNTLNKSKIDRIPVPVPPEAEQQAIADVLDGIRAAISATADALQASTALKQAVAQQVFRPEASDESANTSDLSSAWVRERIGNSHTVTSGGTPSRSEPTYWSAGTIPWVKTTEVNYSVITETSEHITQQGLDESAAKMLPVGTVLLAMYGQGTTRGKVAILGIEAATNQACAAIQPTSDAIDSRYLYHYLAWQYDELRQHAHGGQQQNLNLDIVRDFEISYPASVKEQLAIVEVLDALDSKIVVHAARIPILEQLFNTLLTGLMAGELRVSEVDTTVPSHGPHDEGSAA